MVVLVRRSRASLFRRGRRAGGKAGWRHDRCGSIQRGAGNAGRAGAAGGRAGACGVWSGVGVPSTLGGGKVAARAAISSARRRSWAAARVRALGIRNSGIPRTRSGGQYSASMARSRLSISSRTCWRMGGIMRSRTPCFRPRCKIFNIKVNLHDKAARRTSPKGDPSFLAPQAFDDPTRPEDACGARKADGFQGLRPWRVEGRALAFLPC